MSKTATKSKATKESVQDVLGTNLEPQIHVSESRDGNEFTGVARSVICFLNNGEFSNFKIITLHIEKGKVVKTEYSDPYAHFEVRQMLESKNDISLLRLNNKWEDGKTLFE